MNYKEIDNSRIILGLGEKATLDQIKSAYRHLSKKWHPDTCGKEEKDSCHAKMAEINKAYKILMKYIKDYKYSFSEEATTEDDPEEFYKKHFGKAPF